VHYDGELPGEYRQLARIGVEVVGEARHEGRVLGFLFSHRLLEEGPEGAPEAAGDSVGSSDIRSLSRCV